MKHDLAEKDRIFSEAIDLDYSSVAFEVMVNEPDFWETAARWLKLANTPRRDTLYQMTPKRVSKMISLLTAQPSNSACNAQYEQFVIAIHDFLAHSARHLLNENHLNQEHIRQSYLAIPTNAFVPITEEPVSAEGFINGLVDQITKTNSWVLNEADSAALANLAIQGKFPIQLIEPDNLYTNPNTGNPVPTLTNMKHPEQLVTIFATLLNQAALEQLFDHALKNQFPGLSMTLSDTQMNAQETLACCINNTVFKDAFDWQWETLRTQGATKILAAKDRLESTPEAVYSEIESPLVEHQDSIEKEDIISENPQISF